jgi:hypothetical protein
MIFVPQPDLRYYIPPAPKKATLGWWGIGSIACGALAAAFLPAAILDGGEWINKLWDLSPMWAVFCIIGVALGIRGCQFQRHATKRQRTTAFAGIWISLLTFVVLTILVTIMTS